MPTPFQLGSISTGTLKPENLLQAFVNQAESLGWSGGVHNPRINKSKSLDEGIALLTQVLENFCPPFVYFGPHPDDGADFGFWPDWDRLEEERAYHLDELDFGEFWLDENQCFVQFQGGHPTVMDRNRNILWSTA